MESNVSGEEANIISGVKTGVSGDIHRAMEEVVVSQKLHTAQDNTKNQTGILDDPDVSRLYTTLSVAKEEIWKRWNDEDLKREVEKFLGNDIPEVFQGEPRVALVRHIASPNREAIHFFNRAQQMNLQPLFAEYLSDKFVPENSDKYYLGKLLFYDEKVKHGGENVTSLKIVDMAAEDGNAIYDVKTLWGEGLVEFHHRMFHEMIFTEHSFFDMSEWFATHGEKAKDYYVQYLALFLRHGVLAEVFLTYDRKERGFVENILIPAFNRLESTFGIKPLMIPLFHPKDAAAMDSFVKEWMHYPESLKHLIPKNF
jgi:hypothetical protein